MLKIVVEINDEGTNGAVSVSSKLEEGAMPKMKELHKVLGKNIKAIEKNLEA